MYLLQEKTIHLQQTQLCRRNAPIKKIPEIKISYRSPMRSTKHLSRRQNICKRKQHTKWWKISNTTFLPQSFSRCIMVFLSWRTSDSTLQIFELRRGYQQCFELHQTTLISTHRLNYHYSWLKRVKNFLSWWNTWKICEGMFFEILECLIQKEDLQKPQCMTNP